VDAVRRLTLLRDDARNREDVVALASRQIRLIGRGESGHARLPW